MAKEMDVDADFIVTDSTIINLLVAAFFYMMFITALVYNSGSSFMDWLLYFGIVPGIIFTVKAFTKKAAITINKKGISFFTSQVTDWKHFKAAYARQMPLGIGRVSDNVILTVEYYNELRNDGFFKKTIPLTSTQNKSEEEIIAAIELFYNLSR